MKTFFSLFLVLILSLPTMVFAAKKHSKSHAKAKTERTVKKVKKAKKAPKKIVKARKKHSKKS